MVQHALHGKENRAPGVGVADALGATTARAHPLSHGGGPIEAGDQGVMRIATSYFVTEERCPGVSPAGIAFSISSPRL